MPYLVDIHGRPALLRIETEEEMWIRSGAEGIREEGQGGEVRGGNSSRIVKLMN